LEQGPTEKFIIQQCAQQRLPLPEKIANAPELLIGLEFFYMAFLDLTTCRGTGYDTEGPISWLAIKEWADSNEVEGEQREDLFYYINELDKAYLDFKAKKLKSIMTQQTGANR
jgi:hypothetical protein